MALAQIVVMKGFEKNVTIMEAFSKEEQVTVEKCGSEIIGRTENENGSDKVSNIIEDLVKLNENAKCEIDQEHYEDNTWKRKTVYEFSQLPYITQCEILKNLGYEKQQYNGKRPSQVVSEIMINKERFLHAEKIKLEVDKRKGF